MFMTGLTFGDITGFHKHVKEAGSDCELSSGGQCAFADFMHVQFHFGGVAFRRYSHVHGPRLMAGILHRGLGSLYPKVTMVMKEGRSGRQTWIQVSVLVNMS